MCYVLSCVKRERCLWYVRQVNAIGLVVGLEGVGGVPSEQVNKF